MNIAIAGAGAIGCHYGAQLLRAGAAVHFLARGDQLAALQQRGMLHISAGQKRHFTVAASDDPTALAPCDIWLLCCKTTQLEALCAQIAPAVACDAVLITLQNGIRAGEMVAQRFPHHAVVVGSAFIGIRIETAGEVMHSAAGHLHLAPWQRVTETRVQPLLQRWQQAGTETRWVEDGRLMLWRKMVWNCGFNAICAITRRYAREVVNDPALRAIATAAMEELVAVANAEGIALTPPDIQQNLEVTRTMGPVKPSAWQDVERGKKTEVDAINGEVVRGGVRHAIATPVNQTLTALLQSMTASASALT